MNTKLTKGLVRAGDLVAEIDVHLVEGESGWPPYLSLEDAYKLDDVRDAYVQVISSELRNSPTTFIASRPWKPERAR